MSQAQPYSNYVQQARALAAGLREFEAVAGIPAGLREALYLFHEATRADRPALERMRILGLMATTLDLLFVTGSFPAGDAVESEAEPGVTVRELQQRISQLLEHAIHLLKDELLPRLAREEHITLVEPSQLSLEEQAWLQDYFHRNVFPVLTPLAVDPGRPFPYISNYSLNLLAELTGLTLGGIRLSRAYARIKVPRLIPRFIPLGLGTGFKSGRTRQSDGPVRSFVLSEDLISFFLAELFPDLDVLGAYSFRVLRLATGRDPKQTLAREPRIMHRQRSSVVVRLDMERTMPDYLQKWLQEHLGVPPDVCYRMERPLALHHLIDFANLIDNVTTSGKEEID
jgi:polyphosphate kinase